MGEKIKKKKKKGRREVQTCDRGRVRKAWRVIAATDMRLAGPKFTVDSRRVEWPHIHNLI